MRIEIKDLSFRYKKKSPLIIDNASAAFNSGGIYALIGDNGSGKTTLGKLILGLLKPDKGQIFFDGRDIYGLSAGKRAARIGYLFQNPDLQLFAPTVKEELSFPFELKKQLTDEVNLKLEQLIASFHLQGMEDRFPLTMSGGEKQRLALAAVMSRDVEFLILDEPTSAIDSGGRQFITDFINGFAAKGGGVLVITHDEDFLCSLDNPAVTTLKGGKLL